MYLKVRFRFFFFFSFSVKEATPFFSEKACTLPLLTIRGWFYWRLKRLKANYFVKSFALPIFVSVTATGTPRPFLGFLLCSA